MESPKRARGSTAVSERAEPAHIVPPGCRAQLATEATDPDRAIQGSVGGGQKLKNESQNRTLLWGYLLLLVVGRLADRRLLTGSSERLRGEHLRSGSPGRGAFSISASLFRLCGVAHYAIAGLELVRYRGVSRVPLVLRVAGLAGLAASHGLLFWARSVNPFYSPEVRVQDDRGHRVITAGPYRFVRHPGYLASILRLPCSALALGSLWSMAPSTVWLPLTVYWTILEDGVLTAGLEGYTDYTGEVPYRLFPGLW